MVEVCSCFCGSGSLTKLRDAGEEHEVEWIVFAGGAAPKVITEDEGGLPERDGHAKLLRGREYDAVARTTEPSRHVRK